MSSLRPMSGSEYEAFAARSVRDYARDKAAAGDVAAADAQQLAAEEFQRLVPDGLQTPRHHFLAVVDVEGNVVGELWAQERWRAGAWTLHVLDLHIDAAQRRRGYAGDALRALEKHAAALGAVDITLHVFGQNVAAQALYAKLGFRITDISMAKAVVKGE